MNETLKQTVTRLYTGDGPVASRFRYLLILFDGLSILFFVISAPIESTTLTSAIGLVLGVGITIDLLARYWIAPDRSWMLSRIYTIGDIIVIASLLIDPFVANSLAFLRILRGLRLIHSYHLLQDLRKDSRFFRSHEDMVIASINLFVFVFATTSAVYALFFSGSERGYTYIDALYFTVTTLSTTGFGDITPNTPAFKLFSVFIMVVGVALFVQLARSIFQPSRVRYTCPECGLMRHETDAVHCKHCGALLKIETSGSNS